MSTPQDVLQHIEMLGGVDTAATLHMFVTGRLNSTPQVRGKNSRTLHSDWVFSLFILEFVEADVVSISQ